MAEFPDWFTKTALPFFARNLAPYAGQPIKFLQLGAYTGDATEWLFEHILTHPGSVLYDVDTWNGSDERAHGGLDWSAVESHYLERHQDKIDAGRLIRFKGTTDEFFSGEMGRQLFHFIYVDADHEAAQVLKDGLNAMYRVPPGGIVAFDDFLWTSGKGLWADPKPAVEALWTCHTNTFNLLDKGYQIWLRKNKEEK